MLGFALPQFGASARADIARFATTVEELGADSLWVGDRLVTPVNPSVGYAGQDTIPERFRAGFDPFIALAVAAAVTDRVALGASVLVAPWYPPAVLARQLTALDVLSGGRLKPGFGIGWSPEEFAAAGAPFRRRGAQLDEMLDALDAIWTTNPSAHDGQRWTLPQSWIDLKPAQQPRPPFYLSAMTPASLTRVGERGDGWLPVAVVPGFVMPDVLRAQRDVIDAAARAAGRDPAQIDTVVRINVGEGSSPDDVAEAIRALAGAGFSDVFVDLMYVAEDTDDYLRWAKRLLSE
ncbi:TIGR03619 family F420-dependent LLM class oxidoreductase [Mycolicibacterium flavescens]|uniref:LLM class F420-dependent oxidoreductase n=1 Tax=Mycolicibacterium flavescens TaxID=1776 RepID=A0A1E3RBM0_MYCFV|nr:TIGR03619 family F420-dependent LLM class oxidoreductase [Mycolicibacterium flavescens]MCV7279067.1 TIGR03619 family F420-dependent LLM class oxidoreductase [Mycolicibacterium flavescens]ODQ86792.1 LLM class F420-dependent oxidoreductase [Mycolicibacterium flavescens]